MTDTASIAARVVVVVALLVLAFYAIGSFANWFEDLLGKQAILQILNRNPQGMTLEEILAWRSAHWEENVDTFPNLRADTPGCQLLIDALCAGGEVRAEERSGLRFYFLDAEGRTSTPRR